MHEVQEEPLAQPFGVRPSPPRYAGFWIRVGAMMIDAVVVSIFPGVPIGMAMVRFAPSPPPLLPNQSDFDFLLTYLFALIAFLGWLLLANLAAQWPYFAIMESSSRQATLGKMAFGLMVTDVQRRRISFARATARYFVKNVVSHIITLGAGFLFCGWTEKKQCLHDMMVGTLVVYQKPTS
jgi:uncharacterized RDD family membrane protein YckC